MNAIETIARTSYGKLLAILTKVASGDIQLAEDCLSNAYVKALEVWKEQSVIDNPEAWLISTAKNSIIDNFRRKKNLESFETSILQLIEELSEKTKAKDHRLELLFVCAHPAIDERIRIPLMLQTVLGFNTNHLSTLFLVSPPTLEKRLSRAKQKIKVSRIPFEIPNQFEMAQRIDYVLQAVYGLYGLSWESFNHDFEEEAFFLARLMGDLLPNDAEIKGLISLMSFLSSRKEARRQNNVFIPFSDQDVLLWNSKLIEEGESYLHQAFKLSRIDHFQIEASIQSALIHQKLSGNMLTAEIQRLYGALIDLRPSVGLFVDYAAFLIEIDKLNEAKQILEKIDQKQASQYQPFWITKAQLSQKANDFASMKKHLLIGLGLTQDQSVRNYLLNKMDRYCA